MVRLITIIFALFFSSLSLSAKTQPVDEFIFNGFNQTDPSQLITLSSASIIKPSGALRLTNTTNHVIGHAFYSQPFQMLHPNASSPKHNASSFSTSIVFQIVSSGSGKGGFGLAFTLSPSPSFPGAQADHFLGIFNSTNDGDPSNRVFAVEFDTVNGYKDNSDTAGNHVGINVNSMSSRASEPAAYYKNESNAKEEIRLAGEPIRAWIEYDGVKRVVFVTVAPAYLEKPSKPLMSEPIDLSDIVLEEMFVGLSASTGRETSSHYVLGWNFRVNGLAPELDLSLLPTAPRETELRPFTLQTEVLIATLSALAILGMMFLVHRWRRRPERLEDWELDCPHRFKYKDLYDATKGFNKSEVIGVGGFGAVYKGVIRSSGSPVAVKRIGRNSIQGMREFVAEIESLGHLRHKHLVNLQGWCKQKNDLLLVYDYVPNGSLDSLLFRNDEGSLNWGQRLNIVKNIAAGLLYLHEEWVQVVIHRDVKSSNVLIDHEMNARLGDFGLARLYDHGKVSHTTKVVGTVGYIAPELARAGKASTSSDVFAFGVVVLELVTGKRPVFWDQLVLFEWVLECYQNGRVLDAVDPKLESEFDEEEMKLALYLGLVCTQYRSQARPSMRQVVRYLNGDDQLPAPAVDNWSNGESSEMGSGVFDFISTDTITRTYDASSVGGTMSSNSIQMGR